MQEALTLDRIRSILPHRERMLLFHQAEVCPKTRQARTVLRIGDESAGSPWIEGMSCPHLYLTEALVQLAGLATTGGRPPEDDDGCATTLAEIPFLNLGKAPEPGDIVMLQVSFDMANGSRDQFRVSARRGNEEILTGSLTLSRD